jgi:hypothetical protein
MKRLILIAAALIIAGCKPQTDAERLREARHKSINEPFPYVSVRHDKVRQVTCWVYDENQQSPSISCLPDWMIKNAQAVDDPDSVAVYPTGEPCGKNVACIGFSKRRDALLAAEERAGL